MGFMLSAFGKKVLWRIFVPKGEELPRRKKNCIIWSFKIETPYQILLG
jgi:hypothetical protein